MGYKGFWVCSTNMSVINLRIRLWRAPFSVTKKIYELEVKSNTTLADIYELMEESLQIRDQYDNVEWMNMQTADRSFSHRLDMVRHDKDPKYNKKLPLELGEIILASGESLWDRLRSLSQSGSFDMWFGVDARASLRSGGASAGALKF